MKVRAIVVAAASFALFLAIGLAGAGEASASTTYHKICQTGTSNCLWSAGYRKAVQVRNANQYSDTNFYAINARTWDNRTVYEYKQVGTNNCLTEAFAQWPEIIMYTCGAGNPEQEWFRSSTGNHFVAVYASGQLYGWQCLAYSYGTLVTEPCGSGKEEAWTW